MKTLHLAVYFCPDLALVLFLDNSQVTHLICIRLKHLLYKLLVLHGFPKSAVFKLEAL